MCWWRRPSLRSDQYHCSKDTQKCTPWFSPFPFTSVSHDAQQEQIFCGLRRSEVVAAQRDRGGKHCLRQPFQQTEVRTGCSSVLLDEAEHWGGSFVVPGTRPWLTPAHCSLTSTSCPSGTKLRSESGYALMFCAPLSDECASSGCVISSVVVWFRGLTWAGGRGRGSAWPELFTRTPTSSSWWARLYQSSRLKHPRWWWQSKYFPYYPIASSLEELQPPFLYGWFQDSVHVGLWDEEVSASWFRSSCVYLAKWLPSEYSVATSGLSSYLADVLHLTAGVLLCTHPSL